MACDLWCFCNELYLGTYASAFSFLFQLFFSKVGEQMEAASMYLSGAFMEYR